MYYTFVHINWNKAFFLMENPFLTALAGQYKVHIGINDVFC